MKILDTNNPKEDKLLRKKAKKIQNIQATEIVILTQTMDKICRQPGVAGVAATQLGKPYNVFALAVDGGKSDPMFFYNPSIAGTSDENNTQMEGCLSVPGKSGNVERSNEVELRWEDKKKQRFRWVFKDFMARAIQHEMAHLRGELISDVWENPVDSDHMEEIFNQAKEEANAN